MSKLHSAADVFNRHALNYQSRFMDVSLYAAMLDNFCDQLKTGAEILELGCGPGNITRYLLNKRHDLKVLATDIAPNMLDLAKVNNPSAECRWLDCRDMSSVTHKYEGVMFGFCLPYLSETESRKLIQDCACALKPGGILYMSCMEENEHYRSGIKTNSAGEQLFMHYHKADFLTKTLSEAGLEQTSLSRILTQAEGQEPNTDLILIARKAGIVFE